MKEKPDIGAIVFGVVFAGLPAFILIFLMWYVYAHIR